MIVKIIFVYREVNNYMESEYYYKRVLPYVFLLAKERREMSCELRMYRDYFDKKYFAELPLASKGAGVVNDLYYIFEEMNIEEQKKYFDRTVLLPVTREDVVNVYGENSRRIFPKRRVREKSKNGSKDN